MEFLNCISGSAPLIKRYQAGTTLTSAGVPLLGAVDAATDIGSVEPMGASAPVNTGSQVGVSLDITGTVAATGTVEADILVSCIINPDAILRVKMSSSTTADTALSLGTTTSTDATVLTGVTTFDNGAAWGFSGSNVGVYRRCDDTSGSVSINFPTAPSNGDTYLAVHGYPCSVELTSVETWDLTTDLTQFAAETAVVDMNNFNCVDIEPNGTDNDGRNNSYFHVVANNHLFGSSSLA